MDARPQHDSADDARETHGEVGWERNLWVSVFGSFTTIVGMTLLLPFLPLYVEELGVTGHADIVQWSGVAFSATFFTAALFAPVWGRLGDLYGRKRMREIDRELAHLARRMKAAKVVDPTQQPDRGRVWFGATVTLADEDDNRRTVTLVGDDEQDPSADRIGWNAPVARALRGAAVGDLRTVRLPAGEKEWEVLAVSYPEAG